MIEETCLEIGELQEHWLADKRARMARREQIHRIDDLIDEFEKLNLADEPDVPVELKGRAIAVIASGPHPLAERAVEPVAIGEWMDALYDVQDGLMFAGDDSD